MKKLIVLILIPFFSFGQSKSIFKGLEYGMTKSEAKKEFKKNKKDYTTVDIGNGFLFRIYQQNFLYDNGEFSWYYSESKRVSIWNAI